MTSEDWPPYCGAEQIKVFHTGKQNGVRAQWRERPELPVHLQLKAMVRTGDIDVEVEAICTRKCHPVTEQHVDVERGLSWAEPGHYVTDPFRPSSG